MKNYFVVLLSLMGILGSFVFSGQSVLAQTLLSQGKTTTASSTESSSYISSYAVDGSFNAFYDIYTGSMAAMVKQDAITTTDVTLDKKISVYPNPASGIVNIKGLTQAADIDVYTLKGTNIKPYMVQVLM